MLPTATRIEFETPADYRAEIGGRPGHVRFVLIPSRTYLMVEGSAKPGEQGFRDAIGTLYPVAYTLHFALKKRGIDAPVGALEGLFWGDKPGPLPVEAFTSTASGERLNWRLQLPVPEGASDEDVAAAIADVKVKKQPPLIDALRCERVEEERAAQVMHLGPYDAETETIERLHAALVSAGLEAVGCHHEIYISDPNRTAPERLKTLIRQAVAG